MNRPSGMNLQATKRLLGAGTGTSLRLMMDGNSRVIPILRQVQPDPIQYPER
jgi:hypothetical protein